MTTAALTIFVGIYSTFFFPFRVSNFMPSKAALEVTIALYVVLFAVGMLWMRRLAGVQLPRRFLTVSTQAGGENA